MWNLNKILILPLLQTSECLSPYFIPFSGKLTHHKICCYYRKGIKLCEIKTFLYKTVCRTHVKGNKLDLQKMLFFIKKKTFHGVEEKMLFGIKTFCLLKTFSKTLILITQEPLFPSRTNLKLCNISVPPKMFDKVITNLDLSQVWL